MMHADFSVTIVTLTPFVQQAFTTHTVARSPLPYGRLSCCFKQANKQTLHTLTALTGLLGVVDAVEEDGDEPLEGVLVHGVNVGQVSGAEEEDLRAHSHWDVAAAGGVNVLLCLLCRRHFGLRCGGVYKSRDQCPIAFHTDDENNTYCK